MSTVPPSDRLTATFVAAPGQTDFPADFKVLQISGVNAGVNIRRRRGDVVSTLAINADFTAVDIGPESFTARLNAAAQGGDLIQVYGAYPAERSRALVPGGAIVTQTYEDDAEAVETQLQEVQRDLARAARLPLGETWPELPPPDQRKGLVDGYDPVTGAPTLVSSTGAKGDPGGNVMAVGPLTGLAAVNVPAGVNMVYTTGFAADGDGGHGPCSLQPVPTANFAGVTGDGRVVVPLPVNGIHNVLAWGIQALGNAGPSQKPIWDKIYAQLGLFTGTPFMTGPKIYAPAQPLTYFFGTDTLELQKRVELYGDSHGFDINGSYGTTFEWAAGCVGLRLERFDTLGGVGPIAPTQSGADGSHIHNLCLKGDYVLADTAPGSGLTVPTWHGLVQHCRARVENVTVFGFSGHGFKLIATGSEAGDKRGNGNEYFWLNNTGLDCGGWAFWIEGADANAGTTINCGGNSCGLGIFADVSFLGGNHSGVHADGCNTLGQGICRWLGHIWLLINRTAGIGAATTPGANNFIWYDLGVAPAGSAYTLWNNAGPWNVALGIFSDNPNARSEFVGCYLEAGVWGHVATPSVVRGGSIAPQYTAYTPFEQSANGLGGVMVSSGGMGGFGYTAPIYSSGFVSFAGGNPAAGKTLTLGAITVTFVTGAPGIGQVQIGANGAVTAASLWDLIAANGAFGLGAYVDPAVNTKVWLIGTGSAGNKALSTNDATITVSGAAMTGGADDPRGTYAWSYCGADGLHINCQATPADVRLGPSTATPGDIVLQFANLFDSMLITTPSTKQTFGRGGVNYLPYTINISGLVVGNRGAGIARLFTTANATPAGGGVEAVGEHYFNVAPGHGAVGGWVVTVQGPSVYKPFWGDINTATAAVGAQAGVAAGAAVEATVAVAGAALGDEGFGSYSVDIPGFIGVYRVASAGNVKASFLNISGGAANFPAGNVIVGNRKLA